MTASADDELDRVYGLPLEEFTKARNDAAKRLSDDGDAEGAKDVKAAKKPTRPAWIVNRLARDEPKKVESLLKAGERLREVSEQVVAGEADPDQLRMTAAAEQREVDALLRAAGGIEGASSASLDRVGETLQAAAGDTELAETIRAGRLDRERRSTSLGLLGTAVPPPAKTAAKKGAKAEAEVERKAKRAEAAARHRAEKRVASAEKSLERARGLEEKAEEALAERRERVAEAEAELESARGELG